MVGTKKAAHLSPELGKQIPSSSWSKPNFALHWTFALKGKYRNTAPAWWTAPASASLWSDFFVWSNCSRWVPRKFFAMVTYIYGNRQSTWKSQSLIFKARVFRVPWSSFGSFVCRRSPDEEAHSYWRPQLRNHAWTPMPINLTGKRFFWWPWVPMFPKLTCFQFHVRAFLHIHRMWKRSPFCPASSSLSTCSIDFEPMSARCGSQLNHLSRKNPGLLKS